MAMAEQEVAHTAVLQQLQSQMQAQGKHMDQLLQQQSRIQAQMQAQGKQMDQLLQQQTQLQAQMQTRVLPEVVLIQTQLDKVLQHQAQDAALARAAHRNAWKRARHRRLGYADSAAHLAPLMKEVTGGAVPLGELPGADVPFPVTVQEALRMGHAALNALAAFYHEDFGAESDLLLARRSMFLHFIGFHVC